MIEEVLKTLTTAVSVIEYARVNGYDTAGIDNLVALWTSMQVEETNLTNNEATSTLDE